MNEAAEAPEEPPSDRHHSARAALLVILITSVSIGSALVAWRASVVGIEASGLAHEALQQRLARHRLVATAEAGIAHDRRLATNYEGHIKEWWFLTRQSVKVPDGGPLVAEAYREHALAEILSPYFLAGPPDVDPADGDARYDEEAALRALALDTDEYRQLEPERTFDLAQRTHTKVVLLVGASALLVTALFFLTLAKLPWNRFRGIATSAALVIVVVSVFGIVWIELALP